MIEDKPIGFRLEGDVGSEGGEVSLFEEGSHLPYRKRVLSVGRIHQQRRLFRKPLYRADLHLYQDQELLNIFREWPRRNDLESAAIDALVTHAEIMATLDPGKAKMVDVRGVGYELKRAIRIVAGLDCTGWCDRDIKYK